MAKPKAAPTVTSQVAKNFRMIRDAAHLTQGEMAAMVGVHIGSYTRYEQGKSSPKHAVLMRVAETFGYSSSDLLMRPNLPPPSRVPKVIGAVEFEIDGVRIVGDFRRADGRAIDGKLRGELARRLLDIG